MCAATLDASVVKHGVNGFDGILQLLGACVRHVPQCAVYPVEMVFYLLKFRFFLFYFLSQLLPALRVSCVKGLLALLLQLINLFLDFVDFLFGLLGIEPEDGFVCFRLCHK